MKNKETLRSMRKKKGVSLRQAAKDLEIDPSTLSKYETGERHPVDENKKKLAEYYGFKVGEFFYGEN